MRTSLTLLSALAVVAVRAGLEDCKHSVKLTAANFDSHIAAASKGSLVAFFAPWCGHCKNLQGAWDEVAADFENEDGCNIAHLDADNADNRPVATRYGVSGYPTLKFFPGGGKPPVDYQSARSADAIRAYMNEHCGTDRQPGGSLGGMAGRIPSLDQLAQKYLGTPTVDRPALLASASAIAETLSNSTAAYYLKIFAKLTPAGTTAAYIEGELERLAKLASKKGTINNAKRDELTLRQNVLRAFASPYDAASSIVADAGASASSLAAGAQASASSLASGAQASAASVVGAGQKVANDAQQAAASVVGGARGAAGDAQASASSLAGDGQATASRVAGQAQGAGASIVDDLRASANSIVGGASAFADDVSASATSYVAAAAATKAGQDAVSSASSIVSRATETVKSAVGRAGAEL